MLFRSEFFLQHFLEMTTTPLPRKADIGLIDPVNHDFSAFVFKIQANMNKAHRDRIAFMRICSGRYDANMEVKHVQGGKVMRLSQPQQIMASERKILEEAYAGDIIGVFDLFSCFFYCFCYLHCALLFSGSGTGFLNRFEIASFLNSPSSYYLPDLRQAISFSSPCFS